MAAWVNGFLGILVSYIVGTQVCSLSAMDIGISLFASNLGGLIALLVILQLEWQPWIKRNLLTRSRRTWLRRSGPRLRAGRAPGGWCSPESSSPRRTK